MSFIVEGIDLPKHYEAVEIKVYIPVIEGYTKCIQEVSALFSGENLDSIIQIPKGHGRLIDGDKLKLARHDIYVEEINYRHRCIHIENIDEAPTILEAEE